MSERDMATLLDLVERHLGAEWRGVVEWLREQNGLDDIERRLATGDINSVVQSIDDAALKFAAETHASYVHSAQQASSWLDEQVPDALVRFDVSAPNIVAAARQNQLEWVRGMTAETRETVRQVIIDGHQRSANPREVARDIRDSLGLTKQQEAAVRSYRAALESQDWANALGRALSSGHSDRTIAAARAADRAMTQEQIDLAVERYRASHVTARAEAIARTESLRNVHAGVDAGFQQAIDRGDVDAEDLVGQWNPGPNTRYARPDHRAASLLEQRPAYGEPFDMPDGTQMLRPGDEAGGADNVINCRCTKSVRYRAA